MQSRPPDAGGSDLLPIDGGRFRVLEPLGRGGMASVYRAQEIATQRVVALKRLHLPRDDHQHRLLTAMFEREYHTLTQLAHPHVVEVYDFGVDAAGPYYTMELLDHGDLRELSPLPWRATCELAFDVCSALALIHSRRLVHRDLSPRNVRYTASREAKLIDFGALTAVGPSSHVVGTPPFIAPEVLEGATLDGRTDLYSLGATLYFALTGRSPFDARSIAELVPAFRTRPEAPSAYTPDVPAELDRLVMALLSLDPASRPASAFEVMQRLSSIANLDRNEPASVSRAYLRNPTLVGREETLATFRQQLSLALTGRGSGLFIEAAGGLGRSRLLDACAVEAKTAGVIVLRAGANEGRFGAAHALSRHLLDVCQEPALAAARAAGVLELLLDTQSAERVHLRSWKVAPGDEIALQSALERWFLAICKRQALAVVVDDVDRLDSASLALLAALAHRAPGCHLLLCATASAPASGHGRAVFVLASQCNVVGLAPLQAAQTEALLNSLFDDAANLSALSARIHALSSGRPRECIALCLHLIDRGVISYASGSWTLPERIADTDLPTSTEAVFREQVSRLNPAARWLAQAQALATFEHFSADDYARLTPELTPQVTSGLVAELVANEIIDSQGSGYVLRHAAICSALRASIHDTERRVQHRALAQLYLSKNAQLAAVRHYLAASAPEPALELLSKLLNASSQSNELAASSGLRYLEIAQLLAEAHEAALQIGYRPRPLNELRRWLVLLSFTDAGYHARVGPALLSQLEHDTGLDFYRDAASSTQEPGQRLMHALQRASDRYMATPEDMRVYRVDEAIKYLVHYCVSSIAVGASTLNIPLLASLPALLEPFAPLSPLLHAIWQNTLATIEGVGLALPERARARWTQLYEQLAGVTEQELTHVTMVRNAVAFGVGAIEAQLGLESAADWADILDRDPVQRVNAMYLRKTVRMLRGDFAGAESYRRKAEVLGLQSDTTQMFTNLLTVELAVHYSACDLIGVKRLRDRISSVATKYPGWRVYELLADARFQHLGGDPAAACSTFESALRLCEPDASDPSRVLSAWPRVASGYIETLVEQKRSDAARAYGQRALDVCAVFGIEVAKFDIERALALAEADSHDHATAEARLERLIASQRELRVSGLNLGLSYEARARVAIAAGDAQGFAHYAQLTAAEYQSGRASSLGARYERLMLEARAAGSCDVLPDRQAHAEPKSQVGNQPGTTVTDFALSLRLLETSTQRIQKALELLCEAHDSLGGHLFLMLGGELVHAASHAAESPPLELHAEVREFWGRQLEESESTTQFEFDESPRDAFLRDSAGASLRPVLLHCRLADKHLSVGVLVVTSSRSPVPEGTSNDARVAAAQYFVRTGVATGITS